jgi:DNA-binding response OmpR family regulator
MVKTKILIVDDEPINLDFFEVMLSNLGFTVVKAEDGEEALEKVVSERPDLIILDNVMPRLSGWKVTRLLKTSDSYKEFHDIPIIMFSAMDDVKDKIEGFELGVEDYITKPFNFSEVLARIRAVLRHRELSLQVVRFQEKLALSETLNDSYQTFISDVTRRLEGLSEKQEGSLEEIISFCQRESVILGSEGKALYQDREDPRESTLSLKELEEKFQKHFEAWKKSQDYLNEDM